MATGEHLLSGRYESLDYEADENEISQLEEKRLGYRHKHQLILIKWLIMMMIGVITGLIAVFVDFSVKKLSSMKLNYVQNSLDSCLSRHCLIRPYISWIGINVGMAFISGLLILWEVSSS